MPILARLLPLYLKLLALFQGFGASVHLAEILGLGEVAFARQPWVWQAGHVYFGLFDAVSALGLWLGRRWGVAIWLWLVANQLVMYLGFTEVFSAQPGLLVHHAVTVAIYLLLAAFGRGKGGRLRAGNAERRRPRER